MTDLALLGEQVGVSERTLRRAVSQGTVRATRPTPRGLDLPLGERQYVRRAWPTLAALRSHLRTDHNVRFALLFGSVANGTDASTSDLDVLVDLRDPDLTRVLDLSAGLATATGRRVDLVRLQDAEVDPLFLADVLAEARVLVDRDEVWPTLRRRETGLRRAARRHEARRAKDALGGIDALLAR